MNKVIIVGHHSSGLEEVESLLFRCNMQPALPSRREALLPTNITATICKAHQTPPPTLPGSESEFTQIEPALVWRDLVLDLLAGNSGQELWGWADGNAVFLLDYWRKLDHQTAFILVYNEPQRVLIEAALRQEDPLDGKTIQQLLDNWSAYNGAMLRFFLRNPEACTLVHSDNAIDSPATCINHLREKHHLPLQENTPDPMSSGRENHIHAHHAAPSAPPLALSLERTLTLIGDKFHSDLDFTRDIAGRCLVDNCLSVRPNHLELYEELQAAACLPTATTGGSSTTTTVPWAALIMERRLVMDSLHRIDRHLRTLHDQTKLRDQELKLTLMQLDQAHEELESYFLENKRLRLQAEKFNAPRPERPPRLGSADRVKQHLSYRLGSIIVNKSRSPIGFLTMPFALVGEARRFKRRKVGMDKQRLPPISEYDDAHQAERVRQQLSYRLGDALIRNSKSPVGWIRMPFALFAETVAFKRKRRKSK